MKEKLFIYSRVSSSIQEEGSSIRTQQEIGIELAKKLEMDYEIPDVVAIGVYTAGDITSTQGAPLLAGRFALGAGNSDMVVNKSNAKNFTCNLVVVCGSEASDYLSSIESFKFSKSVIFMQGPDHYFETDWSRSLKFIKMLEK
jgi:hypothetical protein